MPQPFLRGRSVSVLERSAVHRLVVAASACAGLWLALWLVMS